MGALFSRIWAKFFGKLEMRCLMIGLDAAGKTTILYKLKLGEVITTIPTIGFNVEQVEYKNISFSVWDLGGQEKIRTLWRHYYYGVNAIIYVIDSSDSKRISSEGDPKGSDDGDTVAYELSRLLAEDDLKGIPILLLANKQDYKEAVKVDTISERLRLPTIFRGRGWHIQGTCAVTGDGIYEGLDWLSNTLVEINKNRKQ